MQLKYQDKISCSVDVVFPCGEYSGVEHANLQHFACMQKLLIYLSEVKVTIYWPLLLRAMRV